MENESTMNVSLTISALGWLVAVLLFAAALFVGKPYFYRRGYEQARQATAQQNMEAAQSVVNKRVIIGDTYVVMGKVVSTSASSVVIETINPYLLNPLSKTPRKQTVLVTPATVLEKRTLLPAAEFAKALDEARAKGLTTDKASLDKKEPLTLDMLKPGDEIRAFPTPAQDAVKDTFTASQILFVISSQ